MAAAVQHFDWAGTPLGPRDRWPVQLSTLVQLLLDSSEPMFVVWGPGRTIVYNDAYAGVLWSKHPALGQDFLDVWHEIRDILEPLVAKAYAGEPTRRDDLELVMQRKGFPERTHWSYSYTPIKLDDGSVGGFVCWCWEITARVEADQRVLESEARHRGVLANIDEAFTLFDAEFTILEVNQKACDLVQLSRGELIGRSHWERFPGTFDSELGRMYRRVLATGTAEALEHVYHFEDGRRRWFEARSFKVGDGVAVLFRDISRRKETELELAAAHERLRQATLAGGLGVHEFHPETGRLFWDAQVREWWGLGPDDEPTYERFVERLHPDDRGRVQADVDRALHPASGGRYEAEFRVLHPDGTLRHVRATGQASFVDGKAVRLVGTVQDITRDRQMSAALSLADRRKDVFIATLSHELRNPLAPLQSAAHLLASKAVSAEQLSWAAAVIQRQVRHIAMLLDDLLDVSRITLGKLVLKPEDVSLDSVVQAAVETVRPRIEQRNQQLSIRLPDPPMRLHADPLRLAQILSNLLNNAAKYSEAGGRIELTADTSEGGMQITVKDEGIGIAAEDVHQVFEMFSQHESALKRADGGLGIGLALSRGLAQLHGGTLHAESEGPGKGSTFVVRLPGVVRFAAETSHHRAHAMGSAPARLLIVDDNVDAADFLAILLRSHGHTVAVAYDGRSGINLARTLQPELALVDLAMPGMDGLEVARQLRAEPWSTDLTIVALSGYGQGQDRHSAVQAGFDHHITKPADLEALEAVLRARRPG